MEVVPQTSSKPDSDDEDGSRPNGAFSFPLPFSLQRLAKILTPKWKRIALAATSSSASSSSIPNLGDIFVVDVEWSSKRKSLKINQIQAVETKKETEESYARVLADRQYQIEFAFILSISAVLLNKS